jgi:hypothetical protein
LLAFRSRIASSARCLPARPVPARAADNLKRAEERKSIAEREDATARRQLPDGPRTRAEGRRPSTRDPPASKQPSRPLAGQPRWAGPGAARPVSGGTARGRERAVRGSRRRGWPRADA